MVDASSDGLQPEVLLATEVVIEINRDTGRVLAADAEVYFGGDGPAPADLPQQVRWVVRTGLLPDELVIVFGKPLVWAGPESGAPERIPHVEDVFPGPLTLGRTCPQRESGRPQVDFPDGTDCVGWPYGIVVMRGQDTPLIAHPRILIHRFR